MSYTRHSGRSRQSVVIAPQGNFEWPIFCIVDTLCRQQASAYMIVIRMWLIHEVCVRHIFMKSKKFTLYVEEKAFMFTRPM